MSFEAWGPEWQVSEEKKVNLRLADVRVGVKDDEP